MSEYVEFYWQQVKREKLLMQYCSLCQRFVFYPRSCCPYCLGSSLEWRRISGQGRIYSYTIIYISALPDFDNETPYIYAIVELDEGVRIPTNIYKCSPERVRVDMPVRLEFIERNDKKIAVFVPIFEGENI